METSRKLIDRIRHFSGHPQTVVRTDVHPLSLDTFEDFCMRAGTTKAQMVRTYFLG
jgi:hypothetical protein